MSSIILKFFKLMLHYIGFVIMEYSLAGFRFVT